MGRSRKTNKHLGDEWRKALHPGRNQVRAHENRVSMVETEQQEAAKHTHLRNTVLLFADLASCSLGRHFSASKVAVPLAPLLDALAKDEKE